jgi:uroporphyrinogen-III synthase
MTADKVKSILVSQPEPKAEGNSPYTDLADRYKLKIDFRPFIKVAGVSASDFRKDRIDLTAHTAVIFTSRNAIDHYFRICEENRFSVPAEMKYFCVSEAVAYYLQKYVVYRKRKIYFGKATMADLIPQLKKNKDEKYLLPTSDILNPDVPQALADAGSKYTRAILYKTVADDLSDLADVKYDVLVFFSPMGIKSLQQNFPDFVQGPTRIAAFGETTCAAVEEAGLRLDIKAPTPENPSMTMALEDYIKKANKGK